MFDTVQIGRRIAELRKKNDMTQFELADKLSISFQAVSNWERGNSMPDISKLPELAEILGVSIDEILGKTNTVLSDVINENTLNEKEYSKDDIIDAAAIMKPSQIENMIVSSNYNPKVLNTVLPFLEEAHIERLADVALGMEKSISVFLPFLNQEKIENLFLDYQNKGESTNFMIPFLKEETVRELALTAFQKGGIESAAPYLQFMNESDILELIKLTSDKEA